ncbi:protein kinase domain-containing protein [Rhizobium leguminosarum]|uniref:protein kinase domain-containing protein n=1 Tax=Rhizobium leguminosarum TaxID=384 RepID=UPI003D7C346F
MLAKLEHENILQVYHAAAIDDDYAYFATRFCPDGDLDHLIAKGPIAILRAIDIVMQISAGVSFLHGNNYLHRDLKPLNIFCDTGKFVVGDFGSVVQCDENGYARTLTRLRTH